MLSSFRHLFLVIVVKKRVNVNMRLKQFSSSSFDTTHRLCYDFHIKNLAGGYKMSDFDWSDIEEMTISLELEDGSTLEC